MAILKNDKNSIKEFVRISFINSTTTFPDFESAEERYLVPVIGSQMYDHVKALAASADPVPAEPTADQLLDMELLKKCRAVVAPLAYLIDLPTIQAQLTDAGLRTISTDNMQSAHRWEYNEVKEYLAEKGAVAIEALLRFLFFHKSDYQDWTDSDEYQKAASLIFKSGYDFNDYFSLHQPHRIFWDLRPLIREVEDFYIKSILGEAFYNELKAKETPSTEERVALVMIKKGVAQTTILKAVEKRSVKLTERGFTVLLSAGSSDSVNSGDQPASNAGLTLLYDSCQRDSNAYLLQLQEYMNKTASQTVFTTFFNSPYYKAPATEEPESRNAGRTGFFGL
jgi:hypothetical protein